MSVVAVSDYDNRRFSTPLRRRPVKGRSKAREVLSITATVAR
jgi:hypothetical protein